MTARIQGILAFLAAVYLWGCASDDQAPALSYPEEGTDGGGQAERRSSGGGVIVHTASDGSGGSSIEEVDGGEAGAGGTDAGGQRPEADAGGLFALPDLEELEMPEFVSGIDGAWPLGELDQADIDQLCDEFGAYEDRAIPSQVTEPALCFLMVSMFLSQGDVQTCQQQVDDCVSQGGLTQSYECSLTTEDTAGCEATVQQLIDCTVQAAAVSRWFFEQLSCDLLEVVPGDQIPGGADAFSIPACDQLETQCPKVMSP